MNHEEIARSLKQAEEAAYETAWREGAASTLADGSAPGVPEAAIGFGDQAGIFFSALIADPVVALIAAGVFFLVLVATAGTAVYIAYSGPLTSKQAETLADQVRFTGTDETLRLRKADQTDADANPDESAQNADQDEIIETDVNSTLYEINSEPRALNTAAVRTRRRPRSPLVLDGNQQSQGIVIVPSLAQPTPGSLQCPPGLVPIFGGHNCGCPNGALPLKPDCSR